MVTFVTTNAGKVQEARSYFDEPVEQVAFDYPEIQAQSVATVAAHGARAAYRELEAPIIVDDSGLSVEVFDGFPGPYSSFVENTIGIERVWDLVREEDNHQATFRGVVAYCDGDSFEATPEPVDTERRGADIEGAARGNATTVAQVADDGIPVRLFEGIVPGTIVAPRGSGGFGYDPIFEYDGTTFAEMETEEKNAISHRGRALARFAEWYQDRGN